MKLLFMQLSPTSCRLIHLGQNNILSTLFSNTHSLRTFLTVRDQLSHEYGTTGKIIVLYILVFTILVSRQEDKKAMDGIIARITRIQSPFNLLLN
jgi:hypothetical protein